MADNNKFSALSNKIKEHAATTGVNAANNETDGAKRGLFGFGQKPNANNNNAKPTATPSVKPTATPSVKPTATPSVKPTATNVKPTAKTKFTDVPASAYYAEAVAWAVQKGITSGTTETTFTPNNPCHRGHAATFLWRAHGSPAPKKASSPFTDVSDGPFYKAILWAVENGIMEGTSATTFEPTATTSVKPTSNTAAKSSKFTDVPASAYYAEAVEWAVQKGITSGTTETTFTPTNPCHRGHAATFLWRAHGSPAPKKTNNPFTDVSDGPFYKAILWAVENGIMEGTSATTFEPTAPCTRGDVLKYLLRSEGKANATEEEAVKWANVKHLMTGFAGGANAPCTRADIVTILYRAKK